MKPGIPECLFLEPPGWFWKYVLFRPVLNVHSRMSVQMVVGCGFCPIAQKPLHGVEIGPNDTSVSAFQVLVTSISHCPSRTKNPSCIYRRSESMVWNMLNLSLFLPVLFTWFLGQRFADVMNLANFNWTLSSNANSTINFPSAGPSSPY